MDIREKFSGLTEKVRRRKNKKFDLESLRNSQPRSIVAEHTRAAAQLRFRMRAVLTGAALIMVLILMIMSVRHSNENAGRLKAENIAKAEASAAAKEKASAPPESPAGNGACLYMLDSGTLLYPEDDTSLQSPFAEESGLFTGSPVEDGVIGIDFSGGRALVSAADTIKIANSTVLPTGTVSQHSEYGGSDFIACLAMMSGSDYPALIEQSAESTDLSAFADIQTYCKTALGKDLVNAYTPDETPSDTAKRLIDSGSTLLALVTVQDNAVTASAPDTRYVVINGYIMQDSGITFTAADSSRYDYEGLCLDRIDAGLLDSVISALDTDKKILAYLQ